MMDVLPCILGHLPLQAVGHLRQTCRLLRRYPCILAAAGHARDGHQTRPRAKGFLDAPGGIAFLLSLPRITSVSMRGTTRSLFGLHRLQSLQNISVSCADGLDLRPLTELPALRSLEARFSSANVGYHLEELTQLTSLSFSGLCPDAISQLTNLQKLSLRNTYDADFQLERLCQLTELSGPITVCDQRLAALPLSRLHLRADHVDSIETRLIHLSRISSLTALTLQSSASQREEDADLSDLDALPGLQALRLKFCFPDGALSLPALTSLSIHSAHRACRLPDAQDCTSLQNLHFFSVCRTFVISAAHLPPFSPARPLHIRHASTQSGCVALHSDLIQQHRLREGLCVEEWTGTWDNEPIF